MYGYELVAPPFATRHRLVAESRRAGSSTTAPSLRSSHMFALRVVHSFAMVVFCAAMPGTPDGWDLDAYANFIPAPNGRSVNGSRVISVDPALAIAINCTSPILSAAAERFSATAFAWPASSSRQQDLLRLVIEVGDTDESSPQLGMDEGYTLDIPSSGTAKLQAGAVWGVLRGLETFLQMIEYEPQLGTYLVRWAPWSIADAPQFAHRGLLIDTCATQRAHGAASGLRRRSTLFLFFCFEILILTHHCLLCIALCVYTAHVTFCRFLL
eukprot:COSAG02_NODE_605_length_19635_cov_7.106982_12_plen_269_part_00